MTLRKVLIAGVTASLALVGAPIMAGLLGQCGGAYASPVTYTLNIPAVGDLTVAGTITTDGNTGPLTETDIVAFNFIETSALITYTALFNPSDAGSPAILGIGADSIGLHINSAADGGDYVSSEVLIGPGKYSYVNPIVLPGGGIGHYGDCTFGCLENSETYLSPIGYVGDTGHPV